MRLRCSLLLPLRWWLKREWLEISPCHLFLSSVIYEPESCEANRRSLTSGLARGPARLPPCSPAAHTLLAPKPNSDIKLPYPSYSLFPGSEEGKGRVPCAQVLRVPSRRNRQASSRALCFLLSTARPFLYNTTPNHGLYQHPHLTCSPSPPYPHGGLLHLFHAHNGESFVQISLVPYSSLIAQDPLRDVQEAWLGLQ